MPCRSEELQLSSTSAVQFAKSRIVFNARTISFGADLDALVFATYLMNWSDACSTQTNRTDIDFATYASFSVVAFFDACLCVYSGIWLRKWQMNPGDLSQVWPDLRAYCRLTLVVGISHVVYCICQLNYQLLSYAAISGEESMNFSEIEMWHAMALIFYSISFICSSVVKVMLLHRLRSDSPRSAFKSSASLCLQRSSQPILKMLIVIVAICCGTNLVASCFAAAKYIHNASELELLASQPPAIIAYFSRAAESVIIAVACLVVVTSRITSSRHAENKGQQALLNAGKAAGAVVVLITLTRLPSLAGASGKLNSNMAYMARGVVRNSIDASKSQRKILLAICVYFIVAFLLSAGWFTFTAYAINSQVSSCGNICDPCQSYPFLIHNVIFFTPEMTSIVEALSVPLALAVSIWFISTTRVRAFTIAKEMQRTCQEAFGMKL